MIEAIKKRRSIRTFQAKEVEEEKLKEILKAAMFAPTAKHCRSWEFVVIRNKGTIKKLSQTKPSSEFIENASLVLALAADETLDPLWIEDLAIAAAHIYLEATNQGLGTCYIQVRGRFTSKGKDAEEFVQGIIKAPKNIRILCLMPLGYPAEEKPEHQEEEFNPQKIHQETW